MTSITPSNPNEPTYPMVQRRQHFRAPVAEESILLVRVWKMEPAVPIAAKPMPSQELRVFVREVGGGGLSVTLIGKDARPPTVSPQDRLRVEIRHGDREVLIEGRVRLNEIQMAFDGSLQGGIQFILWQGNLMSLRAKSQINSIIGALQRETLRIQASLKSA